MGLRDIPFWGRMLSELFDFGMNRWGARRCAANGHKWHDVGAIVLKQDGGIDELARGAMQRCRRCGIVREKPAAP